MHIIMSCYFPDGEVGMARAVYASQAIDSLAKNLKCKEPLQLVLAHDGPLNEYADAVRHGIWNEVHGPITTTSLSKRSGIGASLNNALDFEKPDVWMYTTDDFLLTKPLDLDKPLALIRAGYDYVRLLLHPDIHCKVKFAINLGWFLELNEQKGGYVVATRPFLMTKRFTEELAYVTDHSNTGQSGSFLEGVSSYEVENWLNSCAIHIGAHEHPLMLAATLSDGTEWEHIGVIEVGHEAIA